MIFLLPDDEKIAFLKAVYSIMMFDREQNDSEVIVLDTLRSELFHIIDFEYTQIKDTKKIAKEINKINSVIPVVYLFNIMYELEKYNNNNKAPKFKQKIDDILDEVRFKAEILKSKLFIYHQQPKNDKEVEDNKEEETRSMIDELYEKVAPKKRINELTDKVKSFKDLFK